MKYSSLPSKPSDTVFQRHSWILVSLIFKSTDQWRLALGLYTLLKPPSEGILGRLFIPIARLFYPGNIKNSTTIYKLLVSLYSELYRPSMEEQCKEAQTQPPNTA